MRYNQWRVAAPNHAGRISLEREGVHLLVATVLSARGMCSVADARDILDSRDRPICDGNQMKDMDRAVARIRLALDRNEHIAVYGDYDVDGITATCLLSQYLTGRGAYVTSYIPDRLEEGYGLNQPAVDLLANQGVTLIITVDCGITAVDEVAWMTERGVDVVITDHHECKDELPAACAVVDPRRPDCPYPFKGLAGVGVALKLCMSLAEPQDVDAVLEEFADLAAIGTVADVMPMVGENRSIVQRGLRALSSTKRQGLAALIHEAGLDQRPLTSVSIGYALAPRINAAGRMGRARLAVDLLLSQGQAQAELLAQELCRLNRERQEVESEIFAQCRQLLGDEPPQGAIVLADPGWHQGVVGIVASRLAEQYGCPAFMICLSNGIGKGSCRSSGGINLFSVLEGCQDLLEAFGGHEQAAGFTVREKNVLALAQRIRTQVAAQAGQAQKPALEIDAVIDTPSMLDLQGVELLNRLEPYGTGNPRPTLMLTEVQVVSRTPVGGGRHLKLRFTKDGCTLDAIFFSFGDYLPPVGSLIDVAFCPQINEYRNTRTVQLQLVDLRQSPHRIEATWSLYERYHRGEKLTAAQAQALLPAREEFVCLWNYLKQQTAHNAFLEQTAQQIVRDCAHASGRPEAPARTLVCLDVMRERGLISVETQADCLQISFLPVQGKVNLDESAILLDLHRILNE